MGVTKDAKAGRHYIDKLGRVVVAVGPTKNVCEGCLYRKPDGGCADAETPNEYCEDVIFKEVTDQNE